MSVTFIFFSIAAILAIASAVVTITSRNPVASALALVFHFFMLAGIYLTLQAQFIAAIQILVYAGAIMVLVIFVIMLLNLGKEKLKEEIYSFRKASAIVLAPVLVLLFISVFLLQPSENGLLPGTVVFNGQTYEAGSIELIGDVLYNNYIFPIEAIAVLLVAAILGAVVLAKRNVN